MREITTHKGNELDDALTITTFDEPMSLGNGEVLEPRSRYRIQSLPEINELLRFQNGPVKEAGVNGISIESLLAICIDRLEGFQSGPYANDYNGAALDKLNDALGWLQQRTKDRQARGVEGTSAQ